MNLEAETISTYDNIIVLYESWDWFNETPINNCCRHEEFTRSGTTEDSQTSLLDNSNISGTTGVDKRSSQMDKFEESTLTSEKTTREDMEYNNTHTSQQNIEDIMKILKEKEIFE